MDGKLEAEVSLAGINGVGAVLALMQGLLGVKALGRGVRLREQGEGHSRFFEQTLRCCLAFVMDQDIPSW